MIIADRITTAPPTSLERIQALTAALEKIGETLNNDTKDVLDRLAREHTRIATCFFDLINSPYTFICMPMPSHMNKQQVFKLREREITMEQYFAELHLLALAYDLAQQAQGSPKRAYRGQ